MSRAEGRPSRTEEPGGSVLIRAFEDRDATAVIALAEELRHFEAGIYPRMKLTRRLGRWYIDDLIADCIEGDGRVFVAELDGTIVGYVCARARVTDEARDRTQITYAMIDDLVVAADCRGRGIGTSLIAAAEDYVRSRGARWVRIGVLVRNFGAYRIYRRAGFSDHLALLEKSLAPEE
jgi:ribosomal protein S18 acetylase RimI-like enzyme